MAASKWPRWVSALLADPMTSSRQLIASRRTCRTRQIRSQSVAAEKLSHEPIFPPLGKHPSQGSKTGSNPADSVSRTQ